MVDAIDAVVAGDEPPPDGRRAFLSLGSNLGDRRRLLGDAVAGLGTAVRAVSAVYETDPVGGPDQGRFLNIVVELFTSLTPRQLLGLCQGLEAAASRVRRERWGPRTLDVDIIWIDGETVDEPDLQIPHPRMWQRRFVLQPLSDLAPDLVPADVLAQADGSVDLVGSWSDSIDDMDPAGAVPGPAVGREDVGDDPG